MLYDKARIFVQAGGGGDGCLSFRREAHVPRGGPDGGDGGRGSDVVLLCDDSLRDLQSFKRRAHYKARRGRHGEGSQRHGADGADLVVRVPPGTQARSWAGTLHDPVVPRRRVVTARGAGVGHEFLAHVERTRLLVHVLDLAPLDGSDPGENWRTVEDELELHDARLAALPRVLALSKADLVAPEETEAAAAEWRARLGELVPVMGTSSGTREGLGELARGLS